MADAASTDVARINAVMIIVTMSGCRASCAYDPIHVVNGRMSEIDGW